jgi:hypothetical protein
MTGDELCAKVRTSRYVKRSTYPDLVFIRYYGWEITVKPLSPNSFDHLSAVE